MESLLALVKPLVSALAMPMTIASGLVVLGLVFWLLGRQRAGVRLMIGAALIVALAAWWPVSEGLLGPLERRYPALVDPSAPGDVAAIVVLGAGWWPRADWPLSSQLNENSAIRLFEGVRLAHALPEARLILSGGGGRDGRPPVASGYAQAARELGIADARILTLDSALDTAQEAYAVDAAIGPGRRILLVTSAAHMPRAMRHFERVGLAPIAAPTQHLTGRYEKRTLLSWLPSSGNLRKTERALHEYLGLLALELDHRGVRP
ncbi:ElyC/SanA/YdcF family protein [Thiocapsa rosea]|uniref:Uncharacterized SAM-binding protein YcdF (DUF218 family) n=1 Tax=Thiocapsa rosea TaxID=69360 RepID=A0A495V871_9GAMM|nr:ElyC/SanA/YdcF family protein [Thiocapsa rosea]RKT45586.1 uncharacterized SAM-binding protein YcdF (DUF218 family) [Thiocapsa rosea]